MNIGKKECFARRFRCRTKERLEAYLRLVTESVATIDPDVFGENLAFLVQGHVLGQVGGIGNVNVVFGTHHLDGREAQV